VLSPPQVMRGQLDRLMSVLGLTHVKFGIIPPGRELPVTPYLGFLIVDDITIVQTFTGTDTLRGEESAKTAEITDLLMARAVTGGRRPEPDHSRHPRPAVTSRRA
jgi:hypothetical protein